ncbi:MAG TPA: hypothetical protein VHV10_20665 [Ktedonobacteraceae bacterium]|jgi:hypothetical protein|nr:hypothetical protein [Ktedonobacteraceae bacterium]
MATVKLISGQVVENVKLTDTKHVGEEGSREAIAHIGDKTYDVYNSIIDGFNDIWHEQMSYETWKMTEGATRFVEGSIESVQESPTD